MKTIERLFWILSVIPFAFVFIIMIIFGYILYLPKMIKNKKELLDYCDFDFLMSWVCKIVDIKKPTLTLKYQRLKKLQKLNKKWYQIKL